VYKRDHPFDDVIHPQTAFQRAPYDGLSPDIVNRTIRPGDRDTQTWNEVKPLSFRGIVDAAATYHLYSTRLAPLDVYPDQAWRPDGAPLGVAVRPLADGRLMMFANLDGMVMYTRLSPKRKRILETAASRPIGQRFDPVELREILTDEQLYGLLGRGAIGLVVVFGAASMIGASIAGQVGLRLASGF
jgi:hypothetical protein